MRISVTDEKAKTIKMIKLDGKPVSTAICLDTEEGWVDVMLPKILKETSISVDDKVNIEEEKETDLDWQEKRLYGKVEILWHESNSCVCNK